MYLRILLCLVVTLALAGSVFAMAGEPIQPNQLTPATPTGGMRITLKIPVPYMDWDGEALVEKTGEEACQDYELLTADTTALEEGKWYAVVGAVENSNRIEVGNDARLILLDDSSLTLSKGFHVPAASSLTIYGQASPTVHAITGGYDSKRCNARSVTISKSSLALKVGKSSKLTAKVLGVKSGRTLVNHVSAIRWYSSNANVAKVSSSGKVKAVGKGKCYIYAMANNGVRSSVKVTVK